MLKSGVFIAFLAIFVNNCEVGAFNLSPVPNVKINLPDLPTSLPQTRSSYFGFSIVLRKNSILIGAPRAQSTLASQSTINETGAVYRCPFEFKSTMELSPTVICQPYIFENSSNIYYFMDPRSNEVRDHQWLGATMDGGTRDDETLLVCAPRFDGGERYMEEEYDYLHGICYSTVNTLYDVPIEVIKYKPLTSGLQTNRDGYYYQMGQLGFSVHITPNNRQLIMGAPGINNWAGSAVRYDTLTGEYDIPPKFTVRRLVLNGYAVASGYLSSINKNELYYVTTTPHENMELGQAFIYEYFGVRNGIKIHAVLQGTQYGEYFGYAALVCDINGDQLDDVLVTAPQYRLEGTVDIGALYVYVNTGNFRFRRQIVEAPFTKEARFGSTIMNLGDINRDGFNDIAVGAPLVDGNGAVVIYLGSKNGLENQPSQLISLPTGTVKSNSYFGHGLSKGVDIDGNGYNDLAIGAPNNEMVYIYRSYPVVNFIINIKTNETSLDLQAEYIEYRICFHTNSDTVIPLQLDIIADVKLRRIAFKDNNAHRLQIQVLAAKFEKCQTFNAAITFLPRQVFVPIRTTVTHSLVYDGKHQMNQSFCTSCAVLDPRISNTTSSVLTYQHGCASEVCDVDLSIEALNVPTELIIGSSNILPIKYYISNKKEKAFDTQVTITNSLNLTLARTPSNCYKIIDQEIICDIAKDQTFLQEFEYLDVEFDISHITDNDEIIIAAMVTSIGNEQNVDDNKSEQKIKLKSYSELEIVGFPPENSLIMRDEVETIDFEYVCKLHNLGPSSIRNVNFWFYIPIVSNDTKQNHYIKHITLNMTLENGEMIHTDFELLPTKQMENQTHRNVTYNTRESFHLPYNRTVFQYCNQSNTLACAKSLFKLSLLEPSKSLTINFGGSLNATAIRDILENEQFLALFINITAEMTDTHEGFLNITQIFTPIVVLKRMTIETPLWIYIAAIVGGILLYLIIAFSLWKFGFFKRPTQDDMQQLLNEKLVNEEKKGECELNKGNCNEIYEDIDMSRSEREV